MLRAGRFDGVAPKLRIEYPDGIAQRLRAETAMTLTWIAHRLELGTGMHLAHLLCRHEQR